MNLVRATKNCHTKPKESNIGVFDHNHEVGDICIVGKYVYDLCKKKNKKKIN